MDHYGEWDTMETLKLSQENVEIPHQILDSNVSAIPPFSIS